MKFRIKIQPFFLAIILFGNVLNSFSQVKFTKDEKEKLKEANFYFKITDYLSALKIYSELYKTDSISGEMNYKMGVCVFKAGEKKTDAVKYLKIASEAGFKESYFYLAQCYHLQNNFDESVGLYKKYLSSKGKKLTDTAEVHRQIEISLRAKEMMKNTESIQIENLGDVINTPYSEYVPLLSADESTIIFTSRRPGSTGGLLDPYNRNFEDIYISYKENGKWTEPKSIGAAINTPTHDACVSLSPDGSTLIMFRTNEDLTSGDLYLTMLEGENWVTPMKLGEHINSEYNEPSASMSADGNTIYFSSNRPGGYGGKDIYRVFRFNNGDWSLPQNLGITINTPYDDDAPFIHPDGVTLYFSSRGHNTMGGYDIFKSVLDPDAEAEYIGQPPKWSTPENIGYPINSTDDDIYFVLSTDGERGYFSSEKPGGHGSQDIYMMQMPGTEIKSLVVIKGTIVADDDTPLRALITLNDDINEVVEGLFNSNSKTGKYLMVVALEKKYTMMVSAEGYKPYSESFDFSKEGGVKEIVVPIKLDKE